MRPWNLVLRRSHLHQAPSDQQSSCDSTKDPKVILVQAGLPSYRQDLIDLLADSLGPGFLLVVGAGSFSTDTETQVAVPGQTHRVTNRYFMGNRILWQHLPFRWLLSVDQVILELNPRIASNWLVALVRRSRGKPVILWGHAWSSSGRYSWTEPVRNFQRRLATTLLLYTNRERSELALRMPNKRIIVAPNALYRAQDMRPAKGHPSVFIYSGRLVSRKKPGLLLAAFIDAVQDLEPDIGLVFIGDGPLRPSLESEAKAASGRVHFRGAISRHDVLAYEYADAIASVSPGYVGLSLIQSIGFGVPMIIAQEEPHSPEIEAAREGFNTQYVTANSVEALRQGLIDVAAGRHEWFHRREVISAHARVNYSVDLMVLGFLDAVTSSADPDKGAF